LISTHSSEGLPAAAAAPAGTRTLARLAAAGAVALIGCGAVVLARVNPSEIGFLPRCPTNAFLHLECAGCGSTRAVHFLLNGQLALAWRHNPAMLAVGLPLVLWGMLDLILVASRGRGLPRPPLPRSLGWIALAALTLYMVARNVPLPAFDSLRPPDPSTVQEEMRDAPL